MIHPLSDVQCKNIPESTRIWQYCVVLPNAKIGEDCNICSHCLIENEAVIGNRCTIKCGVQIWDGITLEDDVFIGSNVTFTNDKYPRSQNPNWTLQGITVCQGATIGAGSTVLPGITIGKKAMIGAGSVVTKDIPAGELWMGSPAKFIRKIEEII
jgi:acetyltransferase-like isoleucine patch superfamily enzyme